MLPAKPGWFQPRTEYPAATEEGEGLGPHGAHLPPFQPWGKEQQNSGALNTPKLRGEELQAFPEWGDDTRGSEAAEGRDK